jgi:hypothetical protein
MNEDAITKAFVEWQQQAVSERAEGDVETDLSVELEAHYNHYGNRGSVDLFLQESTRDSDMEQFEVTDEWLVEIKSPAAIQEVTGANEIIRQFKRHCKYFYRDEARECEMDPGTKMPPNFELCFAPTPAVLEHIEDNEALYKTLRDVEPYVGEQWSRSPFITIVFRHPENMDPVHMPWEYREEGAVWQDAVPRINQEVAASLGLE